MSDVRIGIVGCAGRMGLALIREVTNTPNCILVGGSERPDSAAVGRDLGDIAGLELLGYTVTGNSESLFIDADVVLDFTAPTTTVAHAEMAAASRTRVWPTGV